ncbi:hypothetical protein ALIPUT_01455 [Alistipes putredinis DSM 17216]|uniref:Uncharacterized protein n=1 Tax=Alistipes putredinis DSM 17216 TaxID=445970 RepID=B0MWF0_9BACT|nr:hypothetical protein ALIPUT_01455 [Alistipes putredinis DSM 17216]
MLILVSSQLLTSKLVIGFFFWQNKILQFVIKVLSGTAENGLIDKWSGFN